jgi:hypothetical protein
MFVRFKRAQWGLKAYVVENTRRDGKVVQEIVAHLGSIDSRALGLMPDGNRERSSTAARIRFWEAVNPKLKLLANRAGGDDGVKRLRMAIHARIPWPLQAERGRLDVLDAEAEAASWHRLYEGSQKMIESYGKLIIATTEKKAGAQRDALQEIQQVNKWRAEAQERRKRAGHT